MQDILENRNLFSEIFLEDSNEIIFGNRMLKPKMSDVSNSVLESSYKSAQITISYALSEYGLLGIHYDELKNKRDIFLSLKRKVITTLEEELLKPLLSNNGPSKVKKFIKLFADEIIKDFLTFGLFYKMIIDNDLDLLKIVNGQVTCYSGVNKWSEDRFFSEKEIIQEVSKLCRRPILIENSSFVIPFLSIRVDIVRQSHNTGSLSILNISRQRAVNITELIEKNVLSKDDISILLNHVNSGGSLVIKDNPYGFFRTFLGEIKEKDLLLFELEREITEVNSLIFSRNLNFDAISRMKLDIFCTNSLPLEDGIILLLNSLKIPFVSKLQSFNENTIQELKKRSESKLMLLDFIEAENKFKISRRSDE